MTFLPLIERELSVRARKRSSHWLRVGVVLAGVLFALPQLLLSNWAGAGEAVGRRVFNGIVAVGMVLCSGAFIFTADAISSEQREGTMGLLFLTRLRRLDVVTAKLASHGLPCLLGLAALLPLLMIPLLTGGVAASEAVCEALALLNTLFLSLAIGLYASTRTEDRFAATRAAAAWVVALWIIQPLLGLPFYVVSGGVIFIAASPISSAVFAQVQTSNAFWWCFLAGQGLAWMFLAQATAQLRKAVRQEGSRRRKRRQGPWAPGRNSWSLHKSRLAPAKWVTRRQRGVRTTLWAGALIGFLYLFTWPFFFSEWGQFPPSGFVRVVISLFSWVLLSAGSSAFIAWAASRFFIEGRKTGELELLLTTPLHTRWIILGQWRVLRTALRGPVVAMIMAAFLPFAWMSTGVHLPFPESGYVTVWCIFSLFLAALNVVFGVHALCLAGLWFGIRAATQFQAILWTLVVTNGFPLVASIFAPALLAVFRIGTSNYHSIWHVLTYIPNLVSLIFYLWFTWIAKRKVLRNLPVGEASLPDFRAAISQGLQYMRQSLGTIRQWGTT